MNDKDTWIAQHVSALLVRYVDMKPVNAIELAKKAWDAIEDDRKVRFANRPPLPPSPPSPVRPGSRPTFRG